MIWRLLRCLKRRSPGDLVLRGVFESDPSISEAIHLEEVGLPSGKTTTIQWLLIGTYATARVAEQASRSDALVWNKSVHETSDFRRLFNSIQELDAMVIEDFTAPVRDGGYYHIAWGDRASVRSVMFQIPFKGDRRKKLVELVKSSVAE